MKNIINIALGLSVLLFASCEGNTDYYFNVTNNSSEPVVVHLESEWLGSRTDSTIVPVGVTQQIATNGQRGGNPREYEVAGRIGDLFAQQTTSKKLLDSAVYNTQSRWNAVLDEKRKVPADWEHNYTLTLTDSDFR